MRPALRLAVFLVVASACGSGSDPISPSPDVPPPSSPPVTPTLTLPLLNRVVFESDRLDKNGDIYAMKADGTDVVRLTDGTHGEICPSLSPDGTRIAYFTLGAAVNLPMSASLMKANGADPQSPTKIGALASSIRQCPVWSGDSRVFAVIGVAGYTGVFPGPPDTVKIISRDGVVINTNADGYVRSIALSADGKFIILAETSGTSSETLVRFSVDGSGRKLLGKGSGPAWSPDGTQIAVHCDAGLCTMSADGANTKTISSIYSTNLRYSPDGTHISFLCWGNIVGPCSIATDGSDFRNLKGQFSSNPPDDLVWAPDGKSLIFDCWAPDPFTGFIQTDICSMAADFTGAHNLTSNPGYDKNPSFSPTG